jgi:tRNA-binding EMAP/Myf-like protein
VNDLTEPAGIAALAAGALALLALIFAIVLAVKLRRMRVAQEVVLGNSGRDDLVAHASSLQTAFEALHGRVEEVAERLDGRMAGAERRLDGAIAHRALVRYDAYGELSGHQSTSLALLDADRNGVVLSCIAHRDTARLYCKQVHDGRGEHELSPEEDEAIRLALTGEAPRTVTLD